MKLHRYRCDYPNGSRVELAVSEHDAMTQAQLRWGTPPASVELLDEEQEKEA